MKVKKHSDRPGEMSFWKDGSRMDSRCTEASVAWQDLEWKTRKTYLVTNNEVFNAELYVIWEVAEIALKNGQVRRKARRQRAESHWTQIHIWVDSQAAIKRLQHNALGLGQWLAKRIMKRT